MGCSRHGATAQATKSSAEIIEAVARAERAKGIDYLKGFMSAKQRKMLQNPKTAALAIGHAVHDATAQALRDLYGSRFSYYRNKGVDFVDHMTGEIVELTTHAQRADKEWKYGLRADQVATY